MADRDPGVTARLWLFDFDNTLAELEAVVDWMQSRVELEAYLRSAGVGNAIFAEFPRGNLRMYEGLRGRLFGNLRPGIVNAANASSVGKGGDGLAVAALARSDPAAMLRQASDIIERYELAGADRAAPMPGAAGVLRALRARNTPAVIVTSNSSRAVRRWLERNGIATSVASIIGRDCELPLKPDPAMVLRALEQARANAAEAVFIGDSEADLAAARGAGVKFYGVAAKRAARERLLALGVGQIFESPAALARDLNFPINPMDCETSQRQLKPR